MKRLVDIVNFNCDASCLTSSRWMEALAGGKRSAVCQWAELYVRHRRKVVLGFTGATLADIRRFNPEVLEVFNRHPEFFGTVERPFSHDIHLLRRPDSFRFNVVAGVKARQIALPELLPSGFYLPPEFMLSGEQIGILSALGIPNVLINATRFAADYQSRIPSHPYLMRGLLGVRVGCLPINGFLTLKYLDAMQGFDPVLWRNALSNCDADPAILWRDGESCFLLPEGIAREEYWLQHESADVERCLLTDWKHEFATPNDDGTVVTHFPVHSFAAWMKEFRMLGFLARLDEFEDRSIRGGAEEVALWLGLVNSDVLSAVEKRPVKVTLREAPGSSKLNDHVLHRCRREHEAEEYLVLLSRLRAGENVWPLVEASSEPQMRKLQARALLLREISEG